MALLTNSNLHPYEHDAFIQHNSYHHGWANANLVRYDTLVLHQRLNCLEQTFHLYS